MTLRQRFLLLLVLASAGAAPRNPLTVAELTTRIQAATAQKSSDRELARQLARFTPTERISTDTLAALLRHVTGSETKAVLEIQATRSAFLQLPAAELPALPPPLVKVQNRAFSLLAGYLSDYLRGLPNFFCSETILRFDDDASVAQFTGMRVGDLRFRDVIKRRATYSDGRESLKVEQVNGRPASIQPPHGLESTGEFGDILVMLFSPASHTRAVFSHWETIQGKPVEVLAYNVDKANSTYKLETERKQGNQQPTPAEISPAYHGAISFNPDTGAVLRITLQTGELPEDSLMRNVSLVIDYEPTVIGGRTYICPRRSVIQSDTLTPFPRYLGFYLVHTVNETSYQDYRRYETQVQVNFENSKVKQEPSAQFKKGTDTSAANDPWLAPADNANQLFGANLAPGGDDPAKDTTNPLSPPMLPPPPRSLSLNIAPPSVPGHPTFQQNLNEVAIPVVVWDRTGNDGTRKAIGTLTRDDFEVRDDGKKCSLTSFSIQRYSAPEAGIATPAGPTSDQASRPPRSVALIFDDLHMSIAALRQTSLAATAFLKQEHSANTAYAVVALSGKPLLDFTIDREQVLAAIAHLRLNPINAAQGICPHMSYYEADLISNKNDESALGVAKGDAERDCMLFHASDAMIRSIAQQYLQASYQDSTRTTSTIRAILRRMALLKGDRLLLFVSEGYSVPETFPGVNDVMDTAIRSGVVMSTLDANGLAPPPGVDASEERSGSPMQLATKQSYEIEERDAKAASLALLAGASGGRVFRNNNDFLAGFDLLTRPPEAVYLLTFTPPETSKQRFHKLQVKVHGYKGDHVQARQGYTVEPTVETH